MKNFGKNWFQEKSSNPNELIKISYFVVECVCGGAAKAYEWDHPLKFGPVIIIIMTKMIQYRYEVEEVCSPVHYF